MTAYRITIGDYRFENDTIYDIRTSTAVDVVGTELSVDTFTATVDYVVGGDLLFSPKDYNGVLSSDDYLFGTADVLTDITEVPYGTLVMWYADGEIAGKFFVRNIVRIGKTRYKINAMSAIGFLDKQRHFGGLYSRVTVESFLQGIIGNDFDYSVDPAVASETISGWLPVGNKRDNLHMMMQAMGITLTKDENGDIVFVFLFDSDATQIPIGRIFSGGNVDYNALASAVEVTEHSYAQLATAAEQLFDNTSQNAVSNLLIEFSEPYYDLTASSGLTINSSGDNYAIVSGNGTLTGKKYTHNTRTIQKTATTSGADSIVKCDNNTLINALNSEAVANRLLAFYSSRRTVSASVRNNGEKCGEKVALTNAFMESDSGFITAMDTVASTFLRSAIKVIAGYTPTGGGNFYHNRIVIASSGTVTMPSGVTKIRAVLIGGGGGGQGGYDGENGKDNLTSFSRSDSLGYAYTDQQIAYGGDAGAAGESGKILIFDADITDEEQLTVSVGVGGTGGARNGGVGTSGTETTLVSSSIASCSTADGQRVTAYVDPITGDVYAATGSLGHNGGNGGQVDETSLRGYNGTDGFPGGDVGENSGGAGGNGVIATPLDWWPWKAFASGGGGGGAAYGHDGSAGTDGSYVTEAGYYRLDTYGGNGGNGANADAPAAAAYGTGGGGGNGGGGGGNAGGCRDDWAGMGDPSANTPRPIPGTAGAGGTGSAGGNGGAGVIIIYY